MMQVTVGNDGATKIKHVVRTDIAPPEKATKAKSGPRVHKYQFLTMAVNSSFAVENKDEAMKAYRSAYNAPYFAKVAIAEDPAKELGEQGWRVWFKGVNEDRKAEYEAKRKGASES